MINRNKSSAFYSKEDNFKCFFNFFCTFAPMTTISFKPKLFSTLKHYDRQQFMTDLLAGIIVGIVALPLAIAFGIAPLV